MLGRTPSPAQTAYIRRKFMTQSRLLPRFMRCLFSFYSSPSPLYMLLHECKCSLPDSILLPHEKSFGSGSSLQAARRKKRNTLLPACPHTGDSNNITFASRKSSAIKQDICVLEG
eukprot:scaffold26562_cov124-Skeletonema_marinoi.AAC.1